MNAGNLFVGTAVVLFLIVLIAFLNTIVPMLSNEILEVMP